MARLVSTNEKKSTPTTELIRLKKELQRVTEQLASRDCELAEAAASGTNLQSVMDAIGQNAADCVMKSNTVVWRVDGKVKHILALFGSIDAAS